MNALTRLCEMAGCDRHDATARSACGIFYVCTRCWKQVEQLTAIYQEQDAAEAARLAEQAGASA